MTSSKPRKPTLTVIVFSLLALAAVTTMLIRSMQPASRTPVSMPSHTAFGDADSRNIPQLPPPMAPAADLQPIMGSGRSISLPAAGTEP